MSNYHRVRGITNYIVKVFEIQLTALHDFETLVDSYQDKRRSPPPFLTIVSYKVYKSIEIYFYYNLFHRRVRVC